MKVTAVFERGVFCPRGEVNLPERKELVLHFWPDEITAGADLAQSYAEASTAESGLDDWSAVDAEGWK